jgi:hypothetical protein
MYMFISHGVKLYSHPLSKQAMCLCNKHESRLSALHITHAFDRAHNMYIKKPQRLSIVPPFLHTRTMHVVPLQGLWGSFTRMHTT